MNRTMIIPVLAGLLLAPAAYAATPPPSPVPLLSLQSDLHSGMRGDGVTSLQTYLIDQNAGSDAQSLAQTGATGYFGTRTRAALVEFQKLHGITPASGYFGPKTRAFVGQVTSGESSSIFIGILQSVDTGCFVDGACTATVDGKKIVLVEGLRPVDGQTPAVGSLKGVKSVGDLEGKIGSVVKVSAAPSTVSGYDYTLYGNADYYFQVLAPLPKTGPVTLRGTLGCLPVLDPSKPHPMMLCALSFNGDDGLHYGLTGNWTNPSTSTNRVEVTGDFAPDLSSTIFEREGTITVKKMRAI